MPQGRASSRRVGGVGLAATALSSTIARSTAWMRCTPSTAVPGTSAVPATGRDIRCSIATIGSAASLAPRVGRASMERERMSYGLLSALRWGISTLLAAVAARRIGALRTVVIGEAAGLAGYWTLFLFGHFSLRGVG